MLRVALRADASTAIGMGHIARCASLAVALQSAGAEVRLVTRDLGQRAAVETAARRVRTDWLAAPAADASITDHVPHGQWARVGWLQDAAETGQLLDSWRPDWLVIDHYAFDRRLHDRLRTQLGARIAVIDDLADRSLGSDLLVDHNLSADHRVKYAGLAPAGTRFLCGPRFALLGPGYAAAPRNQVRSPARSIGIFMGGVDARDLTSLVWRVCREELGFTGQITVALTSAAPHLADVQNLLNADPESELVVDAPDLAWFYAAHDVQVGAGGGAVWERCCIGAPTLAIIAAENQLASLPALAERGAVIVATAERKEIAAALQKLLQTPELRRALHERSTELVDGLGAKRVALSIAAGNLQVRPAAPDDARTMHAWRNHPLTRAASRVSDDIEWESHVRWLTTALQDPRRRIFIGRAGAIDVGVIRFDMSEQSIAEVSLYLDPEMHGLGLGPALIRAGERAVQQEFGPTNVVAAVLPHNEASARLFASCGYTFERDLWRKTLN